MSAIIHLHQLIQSLTPYEIREIRKSLKSAHTLKSDSKMLSLFEGFLKKGVPLTDGKVSSRDSQMRKHLFNRILQIMRGGQHEEQPVARLFSMMRDMEFLHSRSLIIPRDEILVKAKELAAHYEQYELLLKMLSMERFWAHRQGDKQFKMKLENIGEQVEHIMSLVEREKKFELIYDQLHMRMQHDHRSPDKQAAHNLMKNEIFKQRLPDSFNCHHLYNIIFSTYHNYTGEYLISHRYQKKSYELWETHAHMKLVYPARYKLSLNNFMMSGFQVNKLDEFPQVIAEIKNLASSNAYEAGDDFAKIAIHEMLYFMNTGRLEEATACVQRVEKELPHHIARMKPKRIMTICYNSIAFSFVTQHYPETIKWIEKLMGYSRSDVRKDLVRSALLLRMITGYEMDNSRLFENAINSMQHFANNNKISAYEEAIFTTMKKLAHSVEPSKQKKHKHGLLQDLYQTLTRLNKQDDKSLPTAKHEIEMWLAARLEKIPLKDFYKRGLQHVKKAASNKKAESN